MVPIRATKVSDLNNKITLTQIAYFLPYNGIFGIEMDIIQITS